MKKQVFLFVVLALNLNLHAQLEVKNLVCEGQINPVGIDIEIPHFSWMSESKIRAERQIAYQVLVASSPDLLAKNVGDLWDSGKQSSDRSIAIRYAGKTLETGKNCFWKVRVWSKDGIGSRWSDPAHWSMGLLRAEDWQAKWIGVDKTFAGEDDKGEFRKLAARYLRKEFVVSKSIKKATAYISGLGLYELHINGSKTGNSVLAPGATQYNKTVLYNTFDVTSQLIAGKNAVGIILGNGRYFAMRNGNMKTFGFPKLLMQIIIEFKDGSEKTIVSDESWKLKVNGPITENNEFDGEKYDARLEMSGWDKSGFNDSNWKAVELVALPSGKLTAQLNEPIRVTGHIKPVSVKPLKSGVYIFDMGQNMVGWASLRVKGKKGDKITMRFAELLKSDGGLYVENLRSAQVTDTYILKGNGNETWEPKFTYHGFRYVEVSGLKTTPDLSTITGCIVNDDLATNGSFECSNQTMNQLYKNATWGIRGNYRSFPTDCPQRDERMGWLGDRATGCRGESYVFNNAGLYRKWLGDIRDEQSKEGSIPDVCPAYWYIFHDNVTWDGTSIMITEMLLDQFGNDNVVAENYESMKKWFLYMYNKYARDGIMHQDSYGDWCMPPEDLTSIHSKDPSRITEAGLLGTSFYYHDACVMQRFAKMLDKQEDAQQFSKIVEEMKAGYNNHFFTPKMNYYSNNTVTANLLSLAFGLVPDDKKKAVFDNLVAKIVNENEAKLSVGLIGIMYLQRVLTEYGRPDLALHFATSTEYPSWGYMAKNGATTIWELWNGNTANPAMNSGNHVMMLGDLVIWMHENVGGIKPVEPGFKSIMMKPLIGNEITFAKASHKSPYGNIVSDWRFENSNFSWNIEIPVNTKATVYIPANNADAVLEGNQKASTVTGVRLLEMKDGFAVYEVLSGVYHFVSSNIQIVKPDYTVSPQVKVSPKDSVSATNIRVEMNAGDKDAEIRYTLDDTKPTEDSKLYQTPLELSKHTVLQTRSFKKGVKPGYVTRRVYDVYDRRLNGLNYEYFDGKWDILPDYNTLKPERTGRVNGFILSDIKTEEDYWGVRFKGFIEIQQDGIYTFSTTSDDGSRLFVNGVKVVENDGIHAAFTVYGKIELKKGRYPILLDYFEGNYGEILKVEIDGPGIVRQTLPISMLFFE